MEDGGGLCEVKALQVDCVRNVVVGERRKSRAMLAG